MLRAASTLSHRCLRLSSVALLLLMVLAWTWPAQAEDRVWAGLVLASQVERPKPPPGELGRAALKIQHFFGYNQLELIGSATKELQPGDEHWLVPSQHFWMDVKDLHALEDGYLLSVTLFHDKRQLVETETKVSPASPLIMRGPVHARGQLIFVVQILR